MAEGVAGTRVLLNGTEIATEACHAIVCDSELDLPDMCVITLNNSPEYGYSHKTNHGDSVEVKIAATSGQPKTVFKGEVVGIEPLWAEGEGTKCTLRCFNRLHRLTRGKKSRTFVKMTDKDIASKIAGDWGLSAKCAGDVNIKHDHVYQHNQTDLEFLLARAARINYEVFCEDMNLIFRKRDPSQDSGIELKIAKQAESQEFSLQRFQARLTTAGQVQEVNVRAWNPDKHEEIVGKATAAQTKLGGKDAWSAAEKFGKAMWFDVDFPLSSKEAADAIAKAKLEELKLSYIIGEGMAKGHPDLKAGIVIKIVLGDGSSLEGAAQGGDPRFGGKYYVTGVSHQYSHKSGGAQGGYRTMFKVRKNADS